ncbi:htaa domain protein [Streptomyces laurentii]|uniref:Htaa domain protein n=1 Tax=Streptomyces laurentii TaxID=39478 RepID=A0A160P3B5_STRLU|nr:htaa domain protein [Streptomyces laurentii]
MRHPLSDRFLESSTIIWGMGRSATKILAVNASPEPVRKGATVTVTGRLQHQIGTTWKNYGNAPVTVWFKAKGSNTWKQLGSARTDSTGVATFKKASTVDGWYTMRHSGDGTHFNSSYAYEDYVDVR